jgi:hypothetical protein
MCHRPRTLITLLIAPDSPLAKGRMPCGAEQQEAGIRASFDPVSYGALRASLGEFIALQEVQAMFEDAIRKHPEDQSAQQPMTSTTEESA